MSDLVEKPERRTSTPWITQEVISQMDGKGKWKNVNNEGRKEQMEKECLEIICGRIMEIQRTGLYDLMLTKAKELWRKENCRIQNTNIEDCQWNIVIGHRQY